MVSYSFLAVAASLSPSFIAEVVQPATVHRTTLKGVNQRSKHVTQVQQQRPESPKVTLTWHACKYKVRKLHQRYPRGTFWGRTSGGVDVPCIYTHARWELL